MKRLPAAVLMMTCVTSSFSQHWSKSIEKLDSFISTAMGDWHTMGLSVAITKKDSVIFTKGYGYRDWAKRLPVTPTTIFPIASCSKTFASALMGIAADERKIELHKPAHQYLPQFHLYNNELTTQATITDLLSHRTGVPGHDWAWTFNTNYPAGVYLNRIRHLQPSAALGTRFQYNSFMFFVLSVLAEKIYNKPWNELVAEKFFRPLEMNYSYGSSATLKNRDEMSLTYQYRDSFQIQEFNQMDDLLAGGAMLSTAGDMARWLQMWINGGQYKDRRVLSGEYARKAITSQILVGSQVNPQGIDEPFTNMGLSWFLSSYRGHYKAQHTGNVAGYSSSITFFPFDSVGVVVLANQNLSPLVRLVPNLVADLLFDLGVRDKHAQMLAMRKQFEARQKNPAIINPDTIKARPLLSFTKYCGEFYNDGYGSIKIDPYRNGLLLTYGDLRLVLVSKGSGHGFSTHLLDDGVIYSDRSEGDVLFMTGTQGGIQSFSIPFEPEVKNIVFKRKNQDGER